METLDLGVLAWSYGEVGVAAFKTDKFYPLPHGLQLSIESQPGIVSQTAIVCIVSAQTYVGCCGYPSEHFHVICAESAPFHQMLIIKALNDLAECTELILVKR